MSMTPLNYENYENYEELRADGTQPQPFLWRLRNTTNKYVFGKN
jgi:hypothetical protein